MSSAVLGRFGDSTGRPFLEGRLIIPRLGITADISFLVDTGADISVLMPDDSVRIGLDFKDLPNSTSIGGVGGNANVFVEPAMVLLADAAAVHVFSINLGIMEEGAGRSPTPSLLGRDVLDRCRMTYCPTTPCLELEVISPTITAPIV